MKKILCLLLSVIFIWSIAVPALAGNVQSGDYTYSVNADGKTATITGYTGAAEVLEIPSKLDGYTITAIGDRAFFGTRKLDSVTISGTVKTIGESAFEDCSALRTIDLEEGVTTIGARAFYCSFAKWVYIPRSLKSIGADAFYIDDIYAISRVRYNGTKSEWGKIEIEGGNWWLTSCEQHVLIAEENSDYSYYRDMNSAEGENEHYGSWFLYDYRGTEKNVVIPETLDGHYMSVVGGFSGNEYIESVTISSVNTINNRAFADCKNLKTVKIEGAAYIYRDAFSNCTSLKTVYLPKYLDSIYGSVFENCKSLDTVYFGGSREEWLDVHLFDDHEALEDSNVQCAFDFENEGVLFKPYESTLDGIKISWYEHYGAEKYDVYKTDKTGSKWIKIGVTDKTYFVDTDLKDRKGGTYTVRARKGKTVSELAVRQNANFYEAPKIKSLKNGKSGVRIEWNKVDYANGYYVYRHTPDGYRRIGVTQGTSFVDTNVKSNTKYTYTVRGYSSFKSEFSAFHKGKAITYLATPSISSIVNVTNGIKLKWNKIAGASNYYVYRRTTGGWTRLGKIAGTTFVDKTAKKGVNYEYTVRALNSKIKSSFEEGKSINDFRKGTQNTVLATPSIYFVDNATSGVKLKWNKIAGADYYYVYRKTTGGWTRLGKVEGTTFVDASAKSGVTYTYTVRALNTVAKSSFEAGKSIMRLSVPILRTLTHAHGVNTLKFDAVPGAKYYIVYKRSPGYGWSNIGTTTSTKFVDRISTGQSCTYTVKAVFGETRSYYDVFGVSVHPQLAY